jgi:hypothetical protein
VGERATLGPSTRQNKAAGRAVDDALAHFASTVLQVFSRIIVQSSPKQRIVDGLRRYPSFKDLVKLTKHMCKGGVLQPVHARIGEATNGENSRDSIVWLERGEAVVAFGRTIRVTPQASKPPIVSSESRPHFELDQSCHNGALELPALNRSSWLKIRGSGI